MEPVLYNLTVLYTVHVAIALYKAKGSLHHVNVTVRRMFKDISCSTSHLALLYFNSLNVFTKVKDTTENWFFERGKSSPVLGREGGWEGVLILRHESEIGGSWWSHRLETSSLQMFSFGCNKLSFSPHLSQSGRSGPARCERQQTLNIQRSHASWAGSCLCPRHCPHPDGRWKVNWTKLKPVWGRWEANYFITCLTIKNMIYYVCHL